MKRIILLASVLCAVSACSGGGDGGTASIPAAVASVGVTLGAPQLYPGGSTSASAELRSAAGAVLSGRTVTWSSTATSVATVDGGGAVTAIAQGVTTILATSEGRTGSATLTVAPPPVATISVALAQTSVLVGTPTAASATLRDDRGNVLTGRVISWTSSANNVASVDAGGTIFTVSPGSTLITATSEGRSGVASLTVTAPPITSVTVTGSTRTKVGDSYNYSVTARLADGSVVVRPVTWSIRETSRGVMTSQGILTPLQIGTITLQATIDGTLWEAFTTAYDWETFTSSGSQFVMLEADNLITNKYGTSEYANLVFSCSASGYFFTWISTDNFITQNGSVALSFDGGSPFSQTWDELSPNFRTLWKPGSNGVVKAFALQIASSRVFGFAFTEYLGSAKAMLFRVTGLAPLLTPLLASCSSNAVQGSANEAMQSIAGLRMSGEASSQLRADRQRRAASAPGPLVVPSMQGLGALQTPDVQRARRKP